MSPPVGIHGETSVPTAAVRGAKLPSLFLFKVIGCQMHPPIRYLCAERIPVREIVSECNALGEEHCQRLRLFLQISSAFACD